MSVILKSWLKIARVILEMPWKTMAWLMSRARWVMVSRPSIRLRSPRSSARRQKWNPQSIWDRKSQMAKINKTKMTTFNHFKCTSPTRLKGPIRRWNRWRIKAAMSNSTLGVLPRRTPCSSLTRACSSRCRRRKSTQYKKTIRIKLQIVTKWVAAACCRERESTTAR